VVMRAQPSIGGFDCGTRGGCRATDIALAVRAVISREIADTRAGNAGLGPPLVR
jgi:hypothetical protein